MQLQRVLMDMPEYMACKRGKDLGSWGQLHPPQGAFNLYFIILSIGNQLASLIRRFTSQNGM